MFDQWAMAHWFINTHLTSRMCFEPVWKFCWILTQLSSVFKPPPSFFWLCFEWVVLNPFARCATMWKTWFFVYFLVLSLCCKCSVRAKRETSHMHSQERMRVSARRSWPWKVTSITREKSPQLMSNCYSAECENAVSVIFKLPCTSISYCV